MKRQRVILVLTALLLAAGITALALYAEPVQIVQPPAEQNGSFTVSWPASGGKEITPLSSGVSFSSPVPSAAPSAKDDSSAISVLSSGKPPEERDITPWEVISARNEKIRNTPLEELFGITSEELREEEQNRDAILAEVKRLQYGIEWYAARWRPYPEKLTDRQKYYLLKYSGEYGRYYIRASYSGETIPQVMLDSSKAASSE